MNLWALLAIFFLLATCSVVLIVSHWFTELSTKFNALENLECHTAVSAYESGGPQRLESIMRQHEIESGVRAYLFDRSGQNLSGGPERTSLLSARSLFVRILVRLERRHGYEPMGRVISQSSDSECIVVTPNQENFAVYGDRAIVLLAFLAALCYGIAGYVVLRMRHLEKAIGAFGTGALDVRLPSSSRDPINRLSLAFNQMASRVELLVEAQRRLCLDVSHELRSPLTRLRLAIGLARSGTRGALEQIEMEAVRLNELVEQLLDVARAEVEPSALRHDDIDLESLLIEIIDGCVIEARTHNCLLDLQSDCAGVVIGDAELLRRAIENPLRNAISHSPPGSRVEVTCKGDADSTVISIRDRGPGVPDSALAKIFRPFYRVELDRARSTGGSGLGLAIAERAVALHGGFVVAENAEPGLNVSIRLPRRP